MLLPIKFPLLSTVNAALTGTEILIILAGTSPASFFIFPSVAIVASDLPLLVIIFSSVFL